MSQKETQLEKESESTTFSSSTFNNQSMNTNQRTSNKGLLSRLTSVVSKESSISDMFVTMIVSLLLMVGLGIFIPTSIIPVLLGVLITAFGISSIDKKREFFFSTIVGTGISGFIAGLLFVSLPFGFNFFGALIIGIVSSGLSTVIYEQ